MKEIALLNPEHVSEAEAATYPVREAARAIVQDAHGNIALLHVSKDGYYKLPGGGIDEGEDIIAALKRECLEEIGCDIEVLEEVGSLTEYRKFCTLKQVSYCFAARVVGEKGIPDFTESELNRGFEIAWLSYDDALRALNEGKTDDTEGKLYIIQRDIALLKAPRIKTAARHERGLLDRVRSRMRYASAFCRDPST